MLYGVAVATDPHNIQSVLFQVGMVMSCKTSFLSAMLTSRWLDQSSISQRITHGAVRFSLLWVFLDVLARNFMAMFFRSVVVVLSVVFDFIRTILHIIFLVAHLTFVDMPVTHLRVFVKISEGFFNPTLEAHLTALHGAS